MTCVVGIDLGTTNTTVSYYWEGKLRPFSIWQLVSEGQGLAERVLPSVVYLGAEQEFSDEDTRLPWDTKNRRVVGRLARSRAKEASHRTVQSAKSWLSMAHAARRDPILPVSDIDHRISPLTASHWILEHVRMAWDQEALEGNVPGLLSELPVVITIPASFDPAARELTLEAARLAGYGSVTLLEEPLAALYAWLHHHSDDWRNILKAEDRVLVCDIGGGTTDFSLVQASEVDGSLSLERILVGKHILLGGDNMDLALCELLRSRFSDLTVAQTGALLAQCREAKERFCSESNLQEVTITIAGSGSSMFRSAQNQILGRAEIEAILFSGFFEPATISDRAVKPTLSGLRQSGLDYAADARIFRHLAEFLSSARDKAMPDKVLLNGSMFQSERLREIMLSGIRAMCGSDAIVELQGNDMTQAVSDGAAAYAQSLATGGFRIRASLGHAYYIGVEKNQMAIPGMVRKLSYLCIAPKGLEEGNSALEISREFCLVTGESVRFRLFRSAERQDEVGTLVDVDEAQFEEVSSLEKHLDGTAGEIVPVHMTSACDAVGTLRVNCLEQGEAGREFQLQFEVRSNGAP